MALSATISALLAGRTVRCAHLVELCFATQARRLWNGSYKITTSDGHDWFGLNKLLSIEGLEDDGELQAAEIKIGVSGADARFLQMAVSDPRSEWVGRHVKIYNQFFDSDWSLLDSPFARAAGIMDGLEVTRQPMDPAGTRRTIVITAQNMFYARGNPPISYYTDKDQQRRFPGDRGLQYISYLQDTTIPFPW